jgi:protein-tyrosine phosphatase
MLHMDFRVIFVCMGNICRSPMAEIVFRKQVAEAGFDELVVVDSAGTGGWHVGEPADRRARDSLARRGYPTEHTARQFEAPWFAERDLVVALDRDNVRSLRRLAPDRTAAEGVRLLKQFDPLAESVDVADPYYGDSSGFDEVLLEIEQACHGLLDHLSSSLDLPAPASDVNNQ